MGMKLAAAISSLPPSCSPLVLPNPLLPLIQTSGTTAQARCPKATATPKNAAVAEAAQTVIHPLGLYILRRSLT